MKKSNIFWGILFICAGILWILNSFCIIHISFLSLIKLWPTIFLWIGVSCIPMSDVKKVIANSLILVFAIIFLIYISGNHFEKKSDPIVDTNQELVDDGTVNDLADTIANCTYASLHLKSDATKFKFIFNDSSLVEIVNQKNNINSEIAISPSSDNSQVDINLNLECNEDETDIPSADVALSSYPIWDMDLILNASNGNLDLSKYKIQKLNIESNAAHFNLKLGNLHKNVDIKLDLNASAVKISIPKNMKCVINRESTLTPLNIKGFKKTGVNTYTSEKTNSIEGYINIQLDSDVSAIDITRY